MRKNSYNFIYDNFLFRFIFAFITLIFLVLILSKKEAIYDSAKYWNLANNVIVDGKFSILNFPETFRGYFLPVMYKLMREIGLNYFGSEWILYIIFISLSGALLISVIIPKILNVKCSGLRMFIGSIGFIFLMFYFFRDLILYPLSDIPAMMFSMFSLTLLMFLEKKLVSTNTKRILFVLIISIIAGTFMYAAYNTRTIYMYPTLMSIIIFIYRNRKANKKLLLLTISGIVLGSLVLAFPQIMINKKYTGIATPRVMTEQRSNYKYDLQSWQMYQGFKVARYETYSGDKINGQESAGVSFFDNAGNQILVNEEIDSEFLSISEFLKLFLKYPLDMIGIYTRSLVSYMTPVWTEVYIQDLFVNKNFTFMLNATIWLISLGSFFCVKNDKVINWLKNDSWIIILSVLPCLLIIVGAPEIRFFISVYFLLYGYICYKIDYGVIIRQLKNNPIRIGIFLFAFLFLWIAIAGSVVANGNQIIHLIGR